MLHGPVVQASSLMSKLQVVFVKQSPPEMHIFISVICCDWSIGKFIPESSTTVDYSAGVDALLINFGVQGRTEHLWSYLALGFQWLPFPNVVHVPWGCPCPGLCFWTLQRLSRYVGRQGMIWSIWPKLDALFPSKNLLILQALVLSYWICREICS